jgi:diadenosine tetraphosphate (Ap4A) HIT family hydrolase
VTLYCRENARTPEQRAEMDRLDAAGVCLFCPEHLTTHPRQRVLFSTSHWHATPNEFPYQGTSLHLLLVPHQHVSDFLELPEAARNDFWVALAELAKRYDLRSYALVSRNGDPRRNGATITHLHAHVLVTSEAPDAPPVRVSFSGAKVAAGTGQGTG